MRDKIKLVSSAGAGHCDATTKNKRSAPDQLEFEKYDPVAHRQAAYREDKIK